MDIQLKELIEKIKSEGVAEAENQAEIIVRDAKQKAEETIEKAKREASEILMNAKKEKDRMEFAGKEALRQAGRDLLLRIRENLISVFDSVVKKEVSKALSDSMLQDILPVMLKEWTAKNSDEIDILLSKENAQKLEQVFLAKFSEELKKGVTIKPHPGVKSGFRIAEKDGKAYYDFTSEGIAESLAQHLNPVLSAIIVKAAAE